MLRPALGSRALGLVSILALLIALVPNRASAGPVVPDFDPANFVPGAPIDNPYSPLIVGTTFRFGGEVTDPEDGEKTFETEFDTVTNQTKLIAGVLAVVVRARTFDDGVLIEDTLDFHAQDMSGNVWYLGEDTKAFEYDDNGKLINTDTSGSFLAGVNGAKAGFIMPANPTIGFNYYQEFAAADGALDQATILSLNETFTVPVGSFTNVLRTEETSELEPGVLENKLYAKGVGQIATFEDIQADGKPLNTLVLESVGTSAIPLPPAAWTGALTIAMLAGAKLSGRVRRRRCAQ